MNAKGARDLLGVADSASLQDLRRAYLQRVGTVRLDGDPATFTQLRTAYEALTGATVARADEAAVARDALARMPDSVEARWALLSLLPYATDPEAFAVLREGASRRPEAFLDELLLHFPEKIPRDLLARGSSGAGPARLLLMADAEASEGRQAEALDVLTRALAASPELSPALVRLAVRPVLSLHAHAQPEGASTALALIRREAAARGFDLGQVDGDEATTLAVADELGRLGPSFPLELRQAGALVAKRGDFENARFEARYATRMLSARALRQWRKRLRHEAPTLAKLFALDLSEDELRPRGVPNFRIPWGMAIGIAILATIIRVSLQIHSFKLDDAFPDKLVQDFRATFFKEGRAKTELEACADPASQDCLEWHEQDACARLTPDECDLWREAWKAKWMPGGRRR